MTNRIEYTDNTAEMTTPEDEIILIAITLESKGRPLTLENAHEILAQGLKNAPEAWKITMDDLPTLWAKIIEGD
jgi:hypothetical protein